MLYCQENGFWLIDVNNNWLYFIIFFIGILDSIVLNKVQEENLYEITEDLYGKNSADYLIKILKELKK